ncbi:MAG: efflux RND transporter periplasmic adaptor subunit [Oscillibacter sp.]|nr:efflux RND transporter periplasmic adaptor subunit [Oscillibacter sp.]
MKKPRAVAAILSAALLSVSLNACGSRRDAKQNSQPDADAQSETTAPEAFGTAVQVQRVAAENISTENKVSGRVVAEDEATIMVGISAKCTAVYKDAGDSVQRGDVLCKLDLASTLSQYSASQISYEAAIQSYNDQKALFDQQIAVAEKNVSVAEEQIEVTRKQIAVNEQQIPVTEKQIAVQEAQIPVLRNQIAVQEAQIPVVQQQIQAAEEQLAAGEAQIPVLEKQIALLEPQIALAQKNVSDTEALLQVGAASQMELDNAKIQADQAAFGRDQLQAQLTNTQAQLNSSRAQIQQSKYSIEQLRAQIQQSNYSVEQLQTQIESSRFSVEQMRAQIEQAKFNLTQLELQRDNAKLSVSQLQSTRSSTLAQLEAGIENARSGVQQLDSVLEDVDDQGNVIAPISGTLVTFNAVENSYVSNAMPVAVINGESDMKVTASVSEALVPKLKTGDGADVYISALDRNMTAVIRSVERAANAQTRLYTVTLTLTDPAGDLLTGMFADVTFHTDRVNNAIVVPSEAILTNGDTQYVYIAVGSRAKYVEVSTGMTGTGVTEILSGLDGGEYLITVGQTYVTDGADIRIVGGL